MNQKQESAISAAAAILVLFTAMLDPRISIVLAVIFLLALSLCKYRASG